MKFSLTLLSVLSFGALSLAQYSDSPYYSSIYVRAALAEAAAEADLDYDDMLDLLHARAAMPKKKKDDSWTPQIIGAKPKKDTLKCNSKHVCSGEIILRDLLHEY